MTRLMIVLAAVLLPGMAFAQEGKMFDRIDTDSSGALSAEELGAAASKMPRQREGMDMTKILERLDSDADGQISRAEWDAGREKMKERRGGGEQEPGARLDRAFDMMDADGDGMISREEFRAGAEKMRSMREQRGAGKGGSEPVQE